MNVGCDILGKAEHFRHPVNMSTGIQHFPLPPGQTTGHKTQTECILAKALLMFRSAFENLNTNEENKIERKGRFFFL